MLAIIAIAIGIIAIGIAVFARFAPVFARGWRAAGQRILITGASKGMGREMALRWGVGGGARGLILVARDAHLLRELAREIREGSGGSCQVEIVVGSVSEESVCREACQKGLAALGGLDVVVINAGSSQSGLFESARDADMDAVRNMLETNVNQAFYMVHHALHTGGMLMPPSDDAPQKRFVFIASVAGLVGAPTRSVYGASKAALVNFAECLRCEFLLAGRDHLGVTCICPGPVRTEINASRVNMGGGASTPIPFPEGCPTAAEAAQMIESAMNRNVRLEQWVGARLAVAPFLRALFPGLFERVLVRGAREMLSAGAAAAKED